MALNKSSKTLKIGYGPLPTYFESCAFQKPITCPHPGASMEVSWLLEKYYKAKFDFVRFKGYGVGAPAETDTIFRGVMNGSVDTAGPTIWYVTERVVNLPNFSFPVSSEQLSAVLLANSSLVRVGTADTLTIATQWPVWTVLFAFGVYLYIAHAFRNTFKTSLIFSKLLLNFNTFLLSMTVLLYLNFMATTIAVMLFQPAPKHYPFETFDELAEEVLHSGLKVVGIDPSRYITPGKEFAETDPTLYKFFEANQIPGQVVLVGGVADALKYVNADERIFVSNFLVAKSIENVCDYEIISHSSFPNSPFGYFFNNATPAWFKPDPPLMQATGYIFQHYMQSYLRPNRCVKERPRRGLSLTQTSTLFYLMLLGIICGFVAFFYEICHKKTMQRFRFSSNAEPKEKFDLQTRARILLSDHQVKAIVDGIYEDRGDIWICVSPEKCDENTH